MHRILLPFPLAIIGFLMMLYAMEIIPIFEWQVTESSSDFSSAYNVDFVTSPWFAQLGDSLNDKSYILRWLFITKEKKYCSSEGLDISVSRSTKDALLERASLLLNVNEKTSPWLLGWAVIQIALSGIHMWWFTFRHESRPIPHAISHTIFFTLVLCLFLLPAMKMMGPHLSFATVNDCHGTMIFNAKLLKVSYAVPILLSTGIFAELGALNMMVHQVRASRKRNEPLESVVG